MLNSHYEPFGSQMMRSPIQYVDNGRPAKYVELTANRTGTKKRPPEQHTLMRTTMEPACQACLSLSAFAAATLSSVLLSAAEQQTPTPERVNYARPFEPPTRPAFIPLPPGAVEPDGWLRDWCLAARDGYTGHMDEFDDEFKRAWAADHKMTGERLNWPKGAGPTKAADTGSTAWPAWATPCTTTR